jgi:hypothetical protein
LYGTWLIFVPVTDCQQLAREMRGGPGPDEPKESSPGRAFAIATSSFTDLAGSDVVMLSRKGEVITTVTGARSLAAS